MKRIFLLVMTVFILTVSLQAQERIAVIPFTGISASEGNVLANMVGTELKNAGGYQIAPRTSAINAVIKEQNIQRTGLTDADTIAALGRGANAQYVVSGHIQKLGSNNVISASIIDVETFQQISGDYVEYENIDDVIKYLPVFAKNLLSRMNTDYRSLPTLAVLPFEAGSEASATDRDVLAQILAIQIANTGKYAVIARTTTISNVMKEHNIQRSGLTDETTIAKLGKAINADYVLSGDISKISSTGYMSAQIINVSSITLQKGAYSQYGEIEDGLNLVPKLCYDLTGVMLKKQVIRTQNKNAIGDINALLEKHKGKSSVSDIVFLLSKDIDAQNSNGNTALTYASLEGYTDIAQALIEAGASLDMQDSDGYTALIYASRYGNTDIAKDLIEAGASLDMQNNAGWTALIRASSSGRIEIVKALIEAGANLNIKASRGNYYKKNSGWVYDPYNTYNISMSALDFASVYERTVIVNLLKAAGAWQ